MKLPELLEKSSAIAVLLTSLFLTLSFTYNIAYFGTFGIDINKLPLTAVDYSLTATSFVAVLALVCLSVSFPVKSVFDNINHISKTRDTSAPQNITLVSGLFFLVAIALMFFNFIMIKCNYFLYLNIPSLYVISLCITFSIVIFFYRSNIFSNFKILCVIFCFAAPYFYVAYEARHEALESFFADKKLYININNFTYNMIRPFEKGVLVKNDDLSLSFIFYTGNSIIFFGKNENIIKFYNSQKKISKL